MTHPHHDVKAPKAKRASGSKISNNLVAVSSAAVFSVYMAGYLRTSAAADRLESSSAPRRPMAPVQVEGQQRPGRSEAPANADSSMPQAVRGGAPEMVITPAAASGSPVTVAPSSGASRQPSTPAAVEKAIPNRDTAPTSTETTTTTAMSTPAAAEPAPVAAPVVAAPEAVTAPAPAAAALAAKYKDGTFTGWGTSRHGDIEAQVVIEGGRIISATISQCYTRYPCTYIAPLPPQVVQRQSAEIDFVSRATDSTNAFYYGLVQALAKAKVQQE